MSGIVSKNGGRSSGIVGAGDVGADAVDGSNIADDAIDSEHYADGSIDNAHIADDAIDSEHYANGSIDEAHIADNAVTLAKMAGGTDGQIITFDASGNPSVVGPGTDGQVLTSTGAGSPPAFEAVTSFPGSSVGFKTHRDAGNVSLSSATWTKLIMNSQTWDLGDDYDSSSNYRFDVPTTGKYFLLGAANFSGLADQDLVRLSFYKSGVEQNAHVVGHSKQHASGTGELCNSISGYASLSAGEYIELYAYSSAANIVNSGQMLLAGFQVS